MRRHCIIRAIGKKKKNIPVKSTRNPIAAMSVGQFSASSDTTGLRIYSLWTTKAGRRLVIIDNRIVQAQQMKALQNKCHIWR